MRSSYAAPSATCCFSLLFLPFQPIQQNFECADVCTRGTIYTMPPNVIFSFFFCGLLPFFHLCRCALLFFLPTVREQARTTPVVPSPLPRFAGVLLATRHTLSTNTPPRTPHETRAGADTQVGISLTCDDKLEVASHLIDLGVRYIEGGYPGSNPKDVEFFNRWASSGLAERAAAAGTRLAAFGMTRRRGVTAEEDEGLRALIECPAGRLSPSLTF